MSKSPGMVGAAGPLHSHMRRRLSPERAGGTEMGSRTTAALYLVLMAAVIVVTGLLFFRDRPWGRLTVNIGIVLVFAAFYVRFLKRP